MQRKSALQLAIPASCTLHALAWKPFLTTPNFSIFQFFMNGIYYSSSVIWILQKNFTCQPCELKTQFTSPIIKSSTRGLLPGHYSVYSLCTLFNIISLELEPLNAFLTTLLLRNMKQTSPMKLIKYLYKWLDKVVSHMLSFLCKQYRNDYSCIAYN